MANKNNATVLIVHHSAVAGDSDQFWAINEYHRSIGFPKSSLGYYTGYHYTINKQGVITQTRALVDIGAHTIGWNDKSIGVCLFGNFEFEQPTTAQLKALKGLRDRLGLPVDLHRNRQENRICPGKNFTLDLLDEPIDDTDVEKERRILEYMKAYPQFRSWLVQILISLRKISKS